ncbi:MmcQ/YjbR family DNA-binding protein [Segetibacter sp. 3557_3]|uniref:MmcQ/YjbR family DNA-binding protein n=1 Tax=Segetibacter sp. 3557_3 TaxID=2547429 RepID=UPI00105840DE|nr:MmcQ/YjbR family DNA-binding protein [Segetibacter sp. 3557_3]TDH27297.1 MmcQ/YjbR family DNA-binding protein [Segetibacter sp. 3557_3]
MMKIDKIRALALSFPGTTEQPHFEKTSFRVSKKIFATVDENKMQASLKLSLKDQDIFCLIDKQIIFKVPNKWGNHGWTMVDLRHVSEIVFEDALTSAYRQVAPSTRSSTLKLKPPPAEE